MLTNPSLAVGDLGHSRFHRRRLQAIEESSVRRLPNRQLPASRLSGMKTQHSTRACPWADTEWRDPGDAHARTRTRVPWRRRATETNAIVYERWVVTE